MIIIPPNLRPGKKELRVYRQIGAVLTIYRFGVVGVEPLKCEKSDHGELIRTVPWPAFYESQNPMFFGWTGDIGYEVEGKIASTQKYYPKDCVPKIRQLGYYLEILTTQDLAANGVEWVCTSSYPGPDRFKQLGKVGLSVMTPTPIDEWIEGLLRGVRRGLEAFAPEKVLDVNEF